MRRIRVLLVALLSFGAALFVLLAMPACYSNVADDSPGDPPVPIEASVLGSGSRISKIAAPGPNHPLPDASVDVTGASLIIIDQYDETHDGKSIGSVYVQDVGSHLPYSGITIYKPTYSPASLLIAPGDVIDFTGLYQDYGYDIGSGGFLPYQTTPEAYEPVVTFLFEYKVPTPVVIQASDIANVTPQASYVLGQRWLSMLVEIDDVTLPSPGTMDSEGRVSYFFEPTSEQCPTCQGSTGPVIANQLYDLSATDLKVGQHFSKVIGVCNFFFNFSISPRSPADLVP
jgi:hypothetical protein